MPSSGGIAMTKSLIESVEAGHVLERAEAEAMMEELLSGRVKTPKIVRLLEALNRRRLEVQERAVFNLLGPLTNPAGAQAQLLGVFSEDVIDVVAATLAELGVERAFVVHGAGGLDEISLSGETIVAEVRGGEIRRFTVTPEEFGVARAAVESIRGGTPAENAELIRRVLDGEDGPARDVGVGKSAAALVAAGAAADFREGAGLASFVISSGAAGKKLAALAAFTSEN